MFITIVIMAVAFMLYMKYGDKQTGKPHSLHIDIITEQDGVEVQNLRYFCIKDKGYNVSVWPKDQGSQGMDYIEFNIAGITHSEHIDDHLGEFAATLEPDPTNPYDPRAIKIVTREGHRVGYVPQNLTSNIRQFTPLPCPCYVYIGINNDIYFSECYVKRPE